MSEWTKLLGAVYSYEFKRGEGSGLWHPHVHALALSGASPDGAALSADWKRITGDSHVVEVHALYGDLVKACCEVFKYAVKFGGLPLADNWEAFGALRRHQLIGSIGNLRGVHVPADLTDDTLDEQKWIDLLYRYVDQGGDKFGYSLADSWRNPEHAVFPKYEPLSADTRSFVQEIAASKRGF